MHSYVGMAQYKYAPKYNSFVNMRSIIYIMHAALYSNTLALHVCIESIAETKNLFKTALISKPYNNRLTITIKEHHNNFSYTVGGAA